MNAHLFFPVDQPSMNWYRPGMKQRKAKETWPSGYMEPDWLNKLTFDISSPPPSLWNGAWAGVFWFCILSLFLLGGSEIENRGALAYLCAGIIVSSYGWVATWSGVPGRKSDAIYFEYLKQKARADARSREWSAAELAEIEKNWHWMGNWRENNDDAIALKRKQGWFSRWFWQKIHGPGFVRRSQPRGEEEYLGYLLAEVRSQSLAARLNLVARNQAEGPGQT